MCSSASFLRLGGGDGVFYRLICILHTSYGRGLFLSSKRIMRLINNAATAIQKLLLQMSAPDILFGLLGLMLGLSMGFFVSSVFTRAITLVIGMPLLLNVGAARAIFFCI